MDDVSDMVDAVLDALDKPLAALARRISALEGRELVKGDKGDPGEPGAAGKDGAEGQPGRDGRDGLAGLTGEKGRDGVDGRDGADGKDGFGFDELGVDYDGERTVTLRYARGEEVKTFPVVLPVPIYRGVYRPDQTYVRGDQVTFGGSIWHCNKPNDEKPGDGSAAWTLAAKRGRDGKNGKDGQKGERGLEGKPGRDLTELERRMA